MGIVLTGIVSPAFSDPFGLGNGGLTASEWSDLTEELLEPPAPIAAQGAADLLQAYRDVEEGFSTTLSIHSLFPTVEVHAQSANMVPGHTLPEDIGERELGQFNVVVREIDEEDLFLLICRRDLNLAFFQDVSADAVRQRFPDDCEFSFETSRPKRSNGLDHTVEKILVARRGYLVYSNQPLNDSVDFGRRIDLLAAIFSEEFQWCQIDDEFPCSDIEIFVLSDAKAAGDLEALVSEDFCDGRCESIQRARFVMPEYEEFWRARSLDDETGERLMDLNSYIATLAVSRWNRRASGWKDDDFKLLLVPIEFASIEGLDLSGWHPLTYSNRKWSHGNIQDVYLYGGLDSSPDAWDIAYVYSFIYAELSKAYNSEKCSVECLALKHAVTTRNILWLTEVKH